MIRSFAIAAVVASLTAAAPAQKPPVSLDDLLARSPTTDWRALNPGNTLYMGLPSGRVLT